MWEAGKLWRGGPEPPLSAYSINNDVDAQSAYSTMMRVFMAWMIFAAVAGAGLTASAQVTPINPLQNIETVPCPLAFQNAGAVPGTTPPASFDATARTPPGTAPTPALTNPLTNGSRTNPGTAINPGILNSPQLGNFGAPGTEFNANSGLPALSQPIPGTGFSSGTPLQFRAGSGFSPPASVTPSVGLSPTPTTPINGFNPGATISPALSGSPSTFGVTC
jgi:hypothetical protein